MVDAAKSKKHCKAVVLRVWPTDHAQKMQIFFPIPDPLSQKCGGLGPTDCAVKNLPGASDAH